MEIELLFHVGFHKTGSTWLQNVVFAKSKNFNLLNNYVRPWEDAIVSYLVTTSLLDFEVDYFKKLVISQCKANKINVISAERLTGHPISGGYDAETIAQKIKMSFPNAKILIVTREQESFRKSCYKQVVLQGYPGSFEQFEEVNWFMPNRTSTYFDNSIMANFYENTFKDVLILDFQTFISNKQLFISQLSEYLGVNIIIDKELYNNIINITQSNRKIRSVKFLNKFRKTEYNMFPIIILNSIVIKIFSILLCYFFSNKDLFKS